MFWIDKSLKMTFWAPLESASIPIDPVPQKEIGVKYANKIEKAEAEIDWEEGSKEIYNKIRAFDPFPGTFTFLHNNLIKIVSSRLGNNTHESQPGTIIEVGKKLL